MPFHCNWIPNKRTDILWRLLHRALPLGYCLRHMNTAENSNCIWCEELQTIEHFTFECPISQHVWNIGYQMLNDTSNITIPTSFNDIIFCTQLSSANIKRAVKWLNINIVYEIWRLYTSTKWGNNITKFTNIPVIITHHLNRELMVLQQLPQTVNKAINQPYPNVKYNEFL
ncbi:7360_t:CDS:2, partial [Cetraspora pellucida]